MAHQDPHIKYKELMNEVDRDVSRDTIRRVFREMHMKKWLPKERPAIQQHHAAQRLAWAQKYANFTPEDWKRVIWSDECAVERGEGI